MNGNVMDDVSSVVNIGFDMIMGPMVRWKRDYDGTPLGELDLDQFSMATYLAFKGGNDGGLRPRAIVYDGFSVVGFPTGMDLVCMFLKNNEALTQMATLKTLAFEIAGQMDGNGDDDEAEMDSGEAESDGEVRRIVINMLRGTEMTTPELRKAFELTSSGIWKIMGELEHDGIVRRAGKSGRAVVWALA